MECTQRQECSQEELFTQSERECPEQIGFLGIRGIKHPVKKGPNSIGRDPQTCDIVLDFISVSRKHAVIDVDRKESMLIDLESANKTKLLGKSLVPYMPYPLKNGDVIKFGDVHGIFRLLKEENDLPMTQALLLTQPIYVPETPEPTRHRSHLTSAITVPESPDVSDKDDSFIIASQPSGNQFKSLNKHNFIKPGKTIAIQPVGGNKIDNIFWNSSKKSTSMNLNDSTSSLNDSIPFVKLSEKENEASASNIRESDKQPSPQVKETVSIYEANTQLPDFSIPPSIYSANTQLPAGFNTSSPSIYTADTQLPSADNLSQSIHTANIQLPVPFHSPSIHRLETQLLPGEKLPEICKINEQQDMQFDIFADKDSSIYNAATQMFPSEVPILVKSNNGTPLCKKSTEDSKLNRSEDIILFEDVDIQPDDENFESQAIFTEGLVPAETEPLSQIAVPKSSKRNMRIESDSSTDCEIDDDILSSQKFPEKERRNNDDDTDCEDEMIELRTNKRSNNTAEAVDLEDVATQIVEVLETAPTENANFEDLLQVIEVDKQIEVDDKNNYKIDLDFEDLPTQVLEEAGVSTKKPVKALPMSDEVEISPFKIPLKSAFKAKKKGLSKSPKIQAFVSIGSKPWNDDGINEGDKYYQATQDVFDDLCSQRVPSSEGPNSPRSNKSDMSLNKSDCSDVEERINNFVLSLSRQEVRNVIGLETTVDPIKRVPSIGSDASDLELTPTKKRPFKLMDVDLPSSQEIKTSVSLSTKSLVTVSSSESDTEQNSEDQYTPILFRKKKKKTHDAKMDLTKKFDVEALPTRVITRVRVPSSKIQDSDCKKMTKRILKPKFLTEQDDDVDKEIITENITRLKSNNEKCKNAKDTCRVTKLDESNINNDTIIIEKTKKPDAIKNSEKKCIPDNKKDISFDVVEKESIPHIKSESSKPKSEEIQTEETKKRENKRKKKSSSAVPEVSKVKVDTAVPENPDKPKDTIKADKNVDSSKDIDERPKTKESKRNTKTVAAKTKDEKPRGPIMIEPHTITIPIKEEKTKREYKRKNKVPAKTENTLENHDFTLQPKQQNSKTESLDLTESKRPVRSTRGRKKKSDDFIEYVDVDSQTDKKPNTKAAKKTSPANEIRRSKRQRTVKANEAITKKDPVKSILKKSTIQDQSAVYNLSSESNSDTPMNLKRPAEPFEAPIPKRPRSVVTYNTSLRAAPSRTQKTCYVLFTAFPYKDVIMKLEKLGAVVVTDVMQCTVLVTLQIKRTFKLLCAVGLGKPIVGPNWVRACSDANMIVEPSLYIIKDEQAESRYRFSLERTLCGKRGFLKGYNVSSTPAVKPQPSEMKLIVQCSGGKWQEGGPRWVCLTCAADKELWPALSKRGATLVSTEFILAGVLHQRLDIAANAVRIQ